MGLMGFDCCFFRLTIGLERSRDLNRLALGELVALLLLLLTLRPRLPVGVEAPLRPSEASGEEDFLAGEGIE